ncbi:MAG: radical SAM protein, partial [Pseudomonadota bacterium]|nr:radical SAM protein [Pseudomonadota bacterium]
MQAKNISGQAPGGKRTKLSEVLPLDTPYVVQIFPIYACNFKCNYCIFSIAKDKRNFISDKISMDFALYKKCIDELAAFPNKIKVLRFVGIGEPLLHKDIARMIEYATSKKVANTVEILTNAALLTPKMSDALIAAGLSRLVVSVQGTSAKRYKEISDVELDLTNFIQNLHYFYKHKGDIQTYIKIVDSAIIDKDDEQKFYDLFGNCCDTIAIEHTVPIHSGIDYDKVFKSEEHKVTQFGLPISEVKVCPQPFFTMQINPDGKVVPCYSFEYPEIVGNCNSEAINKVWTSAKFQSFRHKMLDGAEQAAESCRDCSIIKYRIFPEDD